jgi:hypothetical protein
MVDDRFAFKKGKRFGHYVLSGPESIYEAFRFLAEVRGDSKTGYTIMRFCDDVRQRILGQGISDTQDGVEL